MASTHSKKMKRADSKKSHSWWWDSHVSPKNSKWLQDNLEEMDHYIKRMLKLVEEDADSFSKKAELYFKKRPELIGLVEDFYRMYRSLAERYDHATGELKRRISSDIQSQDSVITEEDQRPRRTKSGPRAAGFDVFLGSQKSSSDFNSSKGEESSSVDSECESDDSSVNNYSRRRANDDDEEIGLRNKIAELQDELRSARETIRLQEKEVPEGNKSSDDCNNVEFETKIAELEENLRLAKERIEQSDKEIMRLRDELCGYKSLAAEGKDRSFDDNASKKNASDENMNSPEAECLDSVDKFRVLEDELRITRTNLKKYEEEVARLSQELTGKGEDLQSMQEQFKSAQKEATSWKMKFEREKREVSKLQDRMNRFKTNLSDRDQEIRGLKEAISNANKALSEENEQLQAETNKIAKEKAYLEDSLKELDLCRQSLEEELRRVRLGKAEMEEALWSQIEQLKDSVLDRDNRIEELNKEFDSLKDDLTAQIAALGAEVESKDANLLGLISKAEEGEKTADELRSRVQELEVQVEKKQEVILEGAEEKREAIRQLCLLHEYYRDCYDSLRRAVAAAHRRERPSVTAS